MCLAVASFAKFVSAYRLLLVSLIFPISAIPIHSRRLRVIDVLCLIMAIQICFFALVTFTLCNVYNENYFKEGDANMPVMDAALSNNLMPIEREIINDITQKVVF